MKKNIRILFLQSQGQFSAPVQIHYALIRHFDRERVEVHVACTAGTGVEPPPSLRALGNIPDVHIRPTNFGPPIFRRSKTDIAKSMISTGLPAVASMAGLVQYVKHHNIDIIHTGENRDALYGVLIAKLVGTKSIIHLHEKCDTWMRPHVFWAMRRADGLIGVSQFVAQSAIAVGCQPSKVHHVLNSLDVSHWNYNTDGSAVRREFGIALDAPLLTIISRVVPSKGHALLLKGLAQVKAKMPNIKLLVVGEDDPIVMPKGQNYIAELKGMMHEFGLDEHVIFAGHRSDVQQILATCDLYTMPATDEGFGLACLEAMAMKKPIIALDSGGTPELVEHGKSGFLSPPEDVSQLAENILTLINNPALRWQMGEYSRTRVEQYFNFRCMADDVESVYRLVLGRTAASAHDRDTLPWIGAPSSY